MVRVYDAYGREFSITKQQWRDKVLLGSLESARNDPEKLYSMLAGALKDGFAQDVVPYAEHLHRTDTHAARGAVLLGVVYLELGRLDDAERVLQECLERHGDDGWALLNLAKIYDRRGDKARAEATLWHVLEVDPNQDNGLLWYAAIHRDRGGDALALEAFRRVATLPRSWRARLWLAKDALQRKQLDLAVSLYEEALARAERPVPADLLMQMSGDLGNSGDLDQLLNLVSPHFDPAVHGLPVGNNVIKANLDLGRGDDAKRTLDQLYALRRPDWREHLNFWSTQLAKLRVEAKAVEPIAPSSVAMVAIEGPLWMRDSSPFAALITAKAPTAQRVAIFGSTALLASPPSREMSQLSDAPGRMSRALPLVLAEQVHLGSTAVGVALIPWAQGHGFALFGKPYEDQQVCVFARKADPRTSFIAAAVVDATNETWSLSLRLLRASDGACVETAKARAPMPNIASATEELSVGLMRLLTEHARVDATATPSWYRRPQGTEGSDYLLRLEQQLVVSSMSLDFLRGGTLYGEHEIIEGALQLCVRNPDSATTRILYTQTLRAIKRVHPDILPEYKERTDLLQRDHPIPGGTGTLIERMIAEAFAA